MRQDHDVELPKPRPSATGVESAELDEPEPAPVTPIRRQILADDPTLPLTASRWKLTPHAKDQMAEREFSLAEVLWAAELPELTVACKPAEDGRDRSHLQQRTKGDCTAVVDPHTNHVITVLYADGEEVHNRALQRPLWQHKLNSETVRRRLMQPVNRARAV